MRTAAGFPSFPSVYVVLVNWNGLADTQECLRSLSNLDYPNWHAVVVDNGSTENEAAVLRTEHPQATILRSRKNLGFAGGNNLGLKHALACQSDYVFLLNNDTVVAPDSVTHLVGALEADRRSGMASATIFHYHRPSEVWFSGGCLSLSPENISSRGPAWHEHPSTHDGKTRPYETAFATACALLVRADLMHQLNGFDERFFAYYEDADLNLRAEKFGVRRLVVPAAHVWHKEARSSGGPSSPNVAYYFARNVALLAEKHIPGKRAAHAYYHAHIGPFHNHALVTAQRPSATAQELEQARAVVSGVWCARLRLYGRRQDHPWIERAAAVRIRILASAAPPQRHLMRFYWFLNAHILRRLRKV